MTSENIMITMQDVDLVCQCDPIFHRQLVIAATARVRTENNMRLNNLEEEISDNNNGTKNKAHAQS
jgi:hypothetical protein